MVPQRADLRDVDNVSFRHGGRLQQKSELAPVGPEDQLGGEGLYIGVQAGRVFRRPYPQLAEANRGAVHEDGPFSMTRLTTGAQG